MIISHTINTHTFLILAQKALYWETKKILLVADLHLGKAATFRAHGIPVPKGTSIADLNLLKRLVQRTDCEILYILGDFFHARAGATDTLRQNILQWRDSIPGVKLVLVRGNHDRTMKETFLRNCFDRVESTVQIDDIALRHKPENIEGYYTIAGHVHPAVRIVDKGRIRKTLPCFYFTKSQGLLPSFGSMTGNAIIKPEPDSDVFVLIDNQVFKIPVAR